MARSESPLPVVTEKEFQAQVVELARWCGWWVFHPYDSRRSTPGWPDLTLMRPPRCLFVECKTDRGRVTVEQTAVMAHMAACGLDARLWRPADWDEIEQTLRRRG